MNDELLFEVRGAIAVITINRPDSRNAINKAVREGLRAAFLRFEADESLRVAILTGSGDKAFCAGMDLKEASDNALRVPPRDLFPVLGETIEVSKPVIAAVNGIAYAGGWMFVQMCDLCIASETASFAITESKVGRGMPWAAPLVSNTSSVPTSMPRRASQRTAASRWCCSRLNRFRYQARCTRSAPGHPSPRLRSRSSLVGHRWRRVLRGAFRARSRRADTR